MCVNCPRSDNTAPPHSFILYVCYCDNHLSIIYRAIINIELWPLFEIRVDHSVRKSLPTYSDAFEDTVTLQLVQNKSRVEHTWYVTQRWYAVMSLCKSIRRGEGVLSWWSPNQVLDTNFCVCSLCSACVRAWVRACECACVCVSDCIVWYLLERPVSVTMQFVISYHRWYYWTRKILKWHTDPRKLLCLRDPQIIKQQSTSRHINNCYSFVDLERIEVWAVCPGSWTSDLLDGHARINMHTRCERVGGTWRFNRLMS